MFNTFADANHADDTLRRTTEAADQMRILIIHADGAPDSLPVGLTALGDSVELLLGTSATPTLAQLAPYDGVIAYSNSTFQNPVALGDTLAAYVDLGHAVVIGTFALTSGWAVQGAIMSGNYVTMIPGSNTQSAGSLGWYNSAHPIMNGVTTVTDIYRSQTTFAPGADSVAKWDDGKPYVATSPNMHVVAINNYPGYVNPGRLTGRDWILVYHKALLWAAGGGSGLEEKQSFSISPDFTLCQSKPNPFRDRTVVSYSVPRALDVNITVYDLSGRLGCDPGQRPSACGPAHRDLESDRRNGQPRCLGRLLLQTQQRQLPHHAQTRRRITLTDLFSRRRSPDRRLDFPGLTRHVEGIDDSTPRLLSSGLSPKNTRRSNDDKTSAGSHASRADSRVRHAACRTHPAGTDLNPGECRGGPEVSGGVLHEASGQCLDPGCFNP